MQPERPTETLAERDILPMSRPRKRIPESRLWFSLAMSRLNPATARPEGQRDKRDKTGQCPACPDRDTGHHPIGGVPVVPSTEPIAQRGANVPGGASKTDQPRPNK